MAKPRSSKKNSVASDSASHAAPPTPETNSTTVNPVSAGPINGSQTAAESKTETRRPTRKPEIVKYDARASVVPINLEDEIRVLAYLFSERRGFMPGHEAEDWINAEREVMQRYRQHSA